MSSTPIESVFTIVDNNTAMSTEKARNEYATIKILIPMLFERLRMYAFTTEGGGYFETEKRHLVCKSCRNGGTGFDMDTIQHDTNCTTGQAIALYKKWRFEIEEKYG